MKRHKAKGIVEHRFSRPVFVAFCLLFGVVGTYMIYRSFAASVATVTVTNTPGTTIETQLSTNDVWSGLIDDAPGGQAKMNALHAPLVRLHVGDDSGARAMPEIRQGQWANQNESRPFFNLDRLVNNVFASGQQPLMNVKFAPDWMWTCYPNSVGLTDSQGVGTLKDLTFQNYAQYMARLVDYYNKGSMTTEDGTVITNPAGTSHKVTYWELWNEPDLDSETPCAPSNGSSMTPARYVTMWNAVTAAMLAEDPTLKFVGPATAGAQFGSSTATGNLFIDQLMSGSVTKPVALSFHGYGYWDNTVSDKFIFDGDNSDPADHCCGGTNDMVYGITSIRAHYPTMPIWLTEVNVNADWGNDPNKRPSSEFAAAWWATAFQQTAPLGAGIIHQYDVADGPQFGLIDDQTGNVHIAYYVFQLLNQSFPPGSVVLSSSSDTSGILSLAVQRPDGHISVMVVNRQLVSNTVKSNCGTGGVATTVNVTLSGITPYSASVQQLDKNNVNCTSNAATAPASQALDVSKPLTVSFPGYGVAVLDIVTGSSGGGIPGDANGDGHVTVLDLSILLSHYAQSYAAADFNKDGVVNVLDLSALLTHYGT